MSILYDLYYGNIIPCDSAELLSSEAYKKALADMVECKSDLEEMLNNEKRLMLERFVEASNILSSVIESEMFKNALSKNLSRFEGLWQKSES